VNVQDPQGLYEMRGQHDDLGHPILIQALDGFVDAGRAVRLAREHILSTLDAEVVASFDVDQLFDYRARRPEMIFDTDHWVSFAEPHLDVHVVRDASRQPFLMLSGPEPDVQWERFAAAVEQIARRLGARMIVGLDAIPMGVPHTRPSSVIAHANPPTLVADYTSWLGTVQVPASAGHLLEFRLGNAGIDSVGFAVNVPHYLAQLDYPEAAITLLDSVTRIGNLVIPAGRLTEAAVEIRTNVDEQVAASEEITAIVRALEQQYDAITSGTENSLVTDGSRLPTADELGAEFEQYLARQPRPDDET
jgi:proteasome assembly chaperone (PAC2) family protein